MNHKMRSLVLRAAALLVVTASAAFGQGGPVPGTHWPDRLDFGTVRVGATVEGKLRVFDSGSDTTGAAVATQPPAFVKVRKIETGARAYGPPQNLTSCIYSDVSIAISTREPGEYSGTLKVGVGTQLAEVPVRADHG